MACADTLPPSVSAPPCAGTALQSFDASGGPFYLSDSGWVAPSVTPETDVLSREKARTIAKENRAGKQAVWRRLWRPYPYRFGAKMFHFPAIMHRVL